MAKDGKKVVNKTKTRTCTCRSEYQDKLYGKNVRVMNATGKGLRCTVCAKEHT